MEMLKTYCASPNSNTLQEGHHRRMIQMGHSDSTKGQSRFNIIMLPLLLSKIKLKTLQTNKTNTVPELTNWTKSKNKWQEAHKRPSTRRRVASLKTVMTATNSHTSRSRHQRAHTRPRARISFNLVNKGSCQLIDRSLKEFYNRD